MKYLLSEIAEITAGRLIGKDRLCVHPLTDSRRHKGRQGTFFIAIQSERQDGHRFVPEVFEAGVHSFILTNADFLPHGGSAVIVENGLLALQQLATHHRNQFKGTMVGITGSAGKTVVKEMAYRALRGQLEVYRSPASYNSQLGVALSLLGIEAHHELAIIEAGISERGEMTKLQQMIRPDIGLFTGIGTAHQAGFDSLEEKIKEKAVLFQDCERLLYCSDNQEVQQIFASHFTTDQLIDWAHRADANTHLIESHAQAGVSQLTYCTGGRSHELSIPVTDDHGVENAMLLILLMALLGIPQEDTADVLNTAVRVTNHLEMTHCRWGSSLLMDQSGLDPVTLKLSLDSLQLNLQGRSQIAVLTADPLQGLRNAERLNGLKEVLAMYNLEAIHLVGEGLRDLSALIPTARHFETVKDYLRQVDRSEVTDRAILLKGAWNPDFSAIRDRLMESGHPTVMTVDLEAMVHNLNAFRSLLKPDVQLMVMVKAFSYGSGDAEIAQLLAFHGVDRLAVAYTDEGVTLREKGIQLPIMVMNWGVDDLENLVEYNLEPEVFSHKGLQLIKDVVDQEESTRLSIHLKLDTGMNRLGFSSDDLAAVWADIKTIESLKVVSVFTHLLASDDAAQENKTTAQLSAFDALKGKLMENGAEEILFHVLNTGGILRYPNHQHEMVRLGIGLYGYTSVADKIELETVLSLRTTISQLREVKAGETVGYGGEHLLTSNRRIAILPIGYADGLSRRLGNGVGSVVIHGKEAPYIGNICMDMCMVDVTDIPCEEGDEAEVIGPIKTIETVAKEMGTIPYEVLVGVSGRVRRKWLG